MESGDSKKRATNFSSKEETVLIELVKKYKNQVECKKSDTNTNKIKAQAWIDISKEFNSICGDIYRDPKVLRSKYENIKKRTKHRFADEKSYRLGTGGGPEQIVTISSVDIVIKDIIGNQLTGFSSEFGGDCVENGVSIMVDNEPTVADTQDHMIISCDGSVAYDDGPATSSKTTVLNDGAVAGCSTATDVEITAEMESLPALGKDWSKYTPDMLKTPKCTPLKINAATKNKENTPNKNPLPKKMLHWAECKVELADLQKQYFLEQHQLKMKLMLAEHNERIRLMRRETEARIAQINGETEQKKSSEDTENIF